MDGNEIKNPVASPEIKDHYEVVKVLPGIVRFGSKKVDLTKITLDEAKELEKLNFPYLKKKETTAAKK